MGGGGASWDSDWSLKSTPHFQSRRISLSFRWSLLRNFIKQTFISRSCLVLIPTRRTSILKLHAYGLCIWNLEAFSSMPNQRSSSGFPSWLLSAVWHGAATAVVLYTATCWPCRCSGNLLGWWSWSLCGRGLLLALLTLKLTRETWVGAAWFWRGRQKQQRPNGFDSSPVYSTCICSFFIVANNNSWLLRAGAVAPACLLRIPEKS